MNQPLDSLYQAFYRQFLSPGDLCFDVGANMGGKTAIFLGLGARVIAVEPQSDCAGFLRVHYGRHPNCVIVEKALGAREGTATMYLNDANVLSTLSTEWIQRMGESGRFQGLNWGRQIAVPLTSLDRLIEQYGVPAFCKIDVEGYEYQVLQGLSRPLSALSFEFAEETIDQTVRCVERLQQLGDYEFNFVQGDVPAMKLDRWVDAATICRHLGQRIPFFWGDVYARLKR